MASLSQAPRLGDLPSPHGAFQEHAAHIAKWPAMLSSKGSRGTCIPRGLSTFLPCAFTAHIDHPVSRVPDTPQLHLALTMGTPEGIASCALLIALPVGQPGDDLDRTLDQLLHLGQGRLDHDFHLGKRLGGLHAIIADALESFGHYMLHHATNKRVYREGFVLHS